MEEPTFQPFTQEIFEKLTKLTSSAFKIEEALLDSRIDLAVHSMKDMPAEIPKGLCIGAIPERESSQDVLISKSGSLFSED